MNKLLQVENVTKIYQLNNFLSAKKELTALSNITFSLERKKTLGIVGESGCGKSTLAKVLTRLEKKTEGVIKFKGENIEEMSSKNLHSAIQMVFQDPYQSLNPRKKAKELIELPLLINSSKAKSERTNDVYEMMKKVGLREEFADRYPHHFSGGQRQRLGIARALMLKPEVLILDEPVSALDVSIQSQVLNLLLEIQQEYFLSYLFISHDLSVIGHMSDEIIVMYLGRIVEFGTREKILNNPLHPYTKMLLESAPKINQDSKVDLTLSDKEILPTLNLSKGCTFYNRCSNARPLCKESSPPLEMKEQREVSCFYI